MPLLPFHLTDTCCQHRNEENHSWVKTGACVESVILGERDGFVLFNPDGGKKRQREEL